jgi:hypothetical protein
VEEPSTASKADIAEGDWDVRFVPKADIEPPHSDHVVGELLELPRHF